MAGKITPIRKPGKSTSPGKPAKATTPSPRPASTGPRTAAGKAAASQNAVAHGATSPQLLNDAERAQFTELLQSLQVEYPSTNPLVRLQLERIARLKIQLDRVQDVIDASFLAERLSKTGMDRAAEAMGLTDDEVAQMARMLIQQMHGEVPDGLVDKQLLAVALELIEIDEYRMLTTHEEFQTYLPTFCQYISDQAKERDEKLEKHLSTRQLDPSRLEPAPEGKKLPDVRFGVTFNFGDQAAEKATDIRSVSVGKLQLAAGWMRQQTWQFVRRVYRMRDMEPLMHAAQEAAMPDPDKLDRLMRYQTTINRQLSSAMGELLVIFKRS